MYADFVLGTIVGYMLASSLVTFILGIGLGIILQEKYGSLWKFGEVILTYSNDKINNLNNPLGNILENIYGFLGNNKKSLNDNTNIERELVIDSSNKNNETTDLSNEQKDKEEEYTSIPLPESPIIKEEIEEESSQNNKKDN